MTKNLATTKHLLKMKDRSRLFFIAAWSVEILFGDNNVNTLPINFKPGQAPQASNLEAANAESVVFLWSSFMMYHIKKSENLDLRDRMSHTSTNFYFTCQSPGGGLSADSLSNLASTSISTSKSSPTMPATMSVFAGIMCPKARP